uniref:Zinc finger GRF-type domain-containing protein n=1 Tax=Brassica campestris TaxID=3711 RepID=M4D948_BRACM
MGLDYSYSQPSDSEDLFCNSVDSGYNETDDLIRRDQEEIRLQRGSPVQYPPEPEVEFGIPQRCYCGAQPLLATSSREIGRRYYTCPNVDDGECHVWKWWDDAFMEELRDRDRQVLLLSEKVDSLALLSDNETEQKVAILEKMVYDLAKEKSKVSYRFEFFLGVMVVVVVLVGVVQWFLW